MLSFHSLYKSLWALSLLSTLVAAQVGNLASTPAIGSVAAPSNAATAIPVAPNALNQPQSPANAPLLSPPNQPAGAVISAPTAAAPPINPTAVPLNGAPSTVSPLATSATTPARPTPSSSSTRSSTYSNYTPLGKHTRKPWPTTSRVGTPPDVLLQVPELSVGRIELDVDNLSADINLNANVANLVSVNAGVAISIRKVNITISDVDAELELIVRLGHLVDIVHRVFESLDLNPLLITAINNITSIVETTVGVVDGLLGSITHGGTNLSFLIDNLGNIVQQVVGTAGNLVSSIVGDYQTNMTFTGKQQTLTGGNIQKEYSYGPLNALVNIVFNTLGQIVSTKVVKQIAGGGGGTPPASGILPTNTAPIATPQAQTQGQAPRPVSPQPQSPQVQQPQAQAQIPKAQIPPQQVAPQAIPQAQPSAPGLSPSAQFAAAPRPATPPMAQPQAVVPQGSAL